MLINSILVLIGMDNIVGLTPFVLKCKESSFVLNQTIIILTKFIEKKKNK
jgi:hypothetical protein